LGFLIANFLFEFNFKVKVKVNFKVKVKVNCIRCAHWAAAQSAFIA
jgi:hypothetical protein